jgi:type IV fimbrial biogenesis protein FimT
MNGNSRKHTRECRRTARGRAKSGLERGAGFGSAEILVAVSLLAVLAGLAAPAYQDAIEKRRITNGAEQIVAFVNLIQGESIKRNRAVTVSYATQLDGAWCIGATLGQTPCDCTVTDSVAENFCSIDAGPWVLRDSDVQARNLIQSVSGDGAYVFDPIRGMFVDPTDGPVFGLDAGQGQFRMNVSVIGTGNASLCLPEVSEKIPGIKSCPADL